MIFNHLLSLTKEDIIKRNAGNQTTSAPVDIHCTNVTCQVNSKFISKAHLKVANQI